MQVNEQNYKDIVDRVMFDLGFPRTFDKAIRAKMESGAEKFAVAARWKVPREDGKEQWNTFKLNGFELKEGKHYYNGPSALKIEVDGNLEKSFEFKVFHQRGFTRQQMENIAAGRPVLAAFTKDGVRQEKWFHDIGKKDAVTGLNIIGSVPKQDLPVAIEFGKLPVLLLQDEKEAKMAAIRNGDIADVKMMNEEGKPEIFYVQGQVTGGLLTKNEEGERVFLVKNNYELSQMEEVEVIDIEDDLTLSDNEMEIIIDEELEEGLGQESGSVKEDEQQSVSENLNNGDALGQEQAQDAAQELETGQHLQEEAAETQGAEQQQTDGAARELDAGHNAKENVGRGTQQANTRQESLANAAGILDAEGKQGKGTSKRIRN